VPSSMIFVSLVVLWLLILVPAVARHRQEVARPTVAALSGRVLERPRQHRGSGAGRDPEMGRELEVDVMDEVDQPRQVATRTDRDRDVRVPAARTEPRWRDDAPEAAAVEPETEDEAYPEEAYSGPVYDENGHDDRRWERPPPRYRPGRGGFDPEAAALTARARYAFRQRVVLAMLIVALVTGVVAAVAVPGLWWPHAAVDLWLVGYLVYLRRQVRLEESIRERRAARMAGTRRQQAAEDPELDSWARRGREVTRRPIADGHDVEREDLDPDAGRADDLAEEPAERVHGVGEPLRTGPATSAEDAEQRPDPIEGEPALPRLQPAPAPPLPAGTSLVEVDEDDPELHDLDGPDRPDYRRAAGE
jgi:hypothetical protein